MHRKILLFTITLLYYGLSLYGLYLFSAGLLVTTLMLFALPAWVLARSTHAPSSVLVAIAILGGGLAVLFEAIANLYGLWYTVGSDTARLFGLVSLEAVLATAVQAIFFVLLYEALFDDGIYTVRRSRERISFMLVFLVGVIILVGLHAVVLGNVFLSYSYIWIVGSIVATSFVMLALHKTLSVHFFDRIIDFALVAALPTLAGVWIGAHNVHRVYGYPDAYLGSLTLFGLAIPIDEVLLAIAFPLLIAVIYEIYLDDRG